MATTDGTIRRTRGGRAFVTALVLALSVLLVACDDSPKVTTVNKCDQYLDSGNWDKAIEFCSLILSDEGYGKTAQAYMGRAGIGLLALLDKIGSSSAEGLELLLSAFSVDATQFLDVQTAINYLLLIQLPTSTDAFNLIVSTDVAISTLMKNELGITIDAATGSMVIPGITDSGIEQLTANSTPADIQGVMSSIYASTYYDSAAPPSWAVSDPAIIDLAGISTFVQANALGASLVELGALADLNLSAALDNGICGLASGQTASGVDNTADGPEAAVNFPRRLNTSETAAASLADDLSFVLLNSAGAVDAAREWQGQFRLPSRLVNPDFLQINCGAGLGLGNFTACMAAPAKTSASFTAVTLADGVTNVQCGGGDCAGSPAAGFPVLSGDGNAATDEFAAEGATNMQHLAQVLHQLYPVDNADADPATSGEHCTAGDGWVHAREYDFYLRTLGQ